MTDHENTQDPEATNEGTQSTETPDVLAGGTAAGSPVEGAEISEEDAANAVEPDDNAYEVDGPQAGHA